MVPFRSPAFIRSMICGNRTELGRELHEPLALGVTYCQLLVGGRIVGPQDRKELMDSKREGRSWDKARAAAGFDELTKLGL